MNGALRKQAAWLGGLYFHLCLCHGWIVRPINEVDHQQYLLQLFAVFHVDWMDDCLIAILRHAHFH